MNIKPIRKLPELKENQEWACEGGCNVVRPKKFENVFSESFANDGSSINRQSEFYFTCQNNHLLKVWCTDKSDSVLLPEEFYQEEASKVVQSNSIEESINLLSDDIDSIKDAFIEESFLTNDDAETLELLITRAIQLGELFATRDAKPQAVPEGFVLVPKENISCYWQDNDEPENFCSSESDFDCLGDCIDLGEIMEINKFTQAHVNKEILFGTWFAEAIDPSEKANLFVGTHAECLEIVAKNKAMIEAQEPAND